MALGLLATTSQEPVKIDGCQGEGTDIISIAATSAMALIFGSALANLPADDQTAGQYRLG